MKNMRELGFARIAAAVPQVTVADTEANSAEIIKLCREADSRGCAVVAFPELCITAYTCGDLFGNSVLQRGALQGLKHILKSTADLGTAAVIGLPLLREGRLYNCAAVIQRGKILGVVPKQNIPNYCEFYESRIFTSGTDTTGFISLFGSDVPFGTDLLFRCTDMESLIFGVEICEDLWVPAPPSNQMALSGATVILNLSASDELVGKREYRQQLVSSQSSRLVCAYAYASAGSGESTTDLVFAGHSLIYENGYRLAETQPFETGLFCGDADLSLLTAVRAQRNTYPCKNTMRSIPFTLGSLDPVLERKLDRFPFVPSDPGENSRRSAGILELQAHGLAKRVSHARSRSLVIGISGGLDSTLALLVAVKTMDILGRDPGDIIAVTMPCFGTTGRTRRNAEILCRELSVSFREVDIGESVRRHFKDIGQDFNNHDTAFENGQARERTQVLMDIANMTNGLVVGTGDMSELALGWATYNGDHMSMYGVNASVPKTLVRNLVRYCADTAASPALRDVLLDILATPVSPELLPADSGGGIAQVTEDLVGPYILHDFFLYHMLRHGFGPAKIFALAQHAFEGEFSDEEILKWLRSFCRRFFSQQFKRSCLPDGPKVGSVSLSPRGDWRMPSDASSALWIRELDGIKL